MQTYIQILRNLSKKPRNIKALQRGNILEEYLQELRQKLLLGIKLEDKILNQAIVLKYNILDTVSELKKSAKELTLHLAKMKEEIPYEEISKTLSKERFIFGKTNSFNLSNNYSIVLSFNKGLEIYYKHYLLEKKQCISFDYGRGVNYIDYDKIAA